MPKKSKIRWSDKDRKQVQYTVVSYNAKITRTLKAHPEWAEYLPSKITTDEVKNKIATRQDLNREINSLKRFLVKGAETPFLSETGIKTTKWEKKEIGIKVAVINRARTKERKDADVSTYKGTMGTIESNALKPKVFNIDKIKSSDWDKYVQLVNKQVMATYNDEKIARYKDNYLKAVDNVFGGLGYELKERLSKIPAEQLVKMFYNDPVLQIDFIYDPQELMFIRDNILEHLENYGY